ncbi:hypothetical protein PGB90_008739 [Kerria lacca]
MNLENQIRNKLNSLKPTITTVTFSNGEVHQEIRNEAGELQKIKLNLSSPGFIIDQVPNLSISEILPWLYMGSQDVAYDYYLLKSNNITHILSIGIPCPQYNDISNTLIKAYDLDEFCIAAIFERCFEIINYVKEISGIVFVHCNAGISRSPTVVAAYLIKYYNITPEEALHRIRKKRPKINPNQGFLKQLEDFYFSLPN